MTTDTNGTIVYLELVTPGLDEPASIGRAVYWADRDFPWARADHWNLEWWGVRTRTARRTTSDGLSVRGPRIPFKRVPRLVLVTLAWATHFVLGLRQRPGVVLVARSPHLGLGAALARRFRRGGAPLVVRIVERVASKALHVYGARLIYRAIDAVDRFVLRQTDVVFSVGAFTRDLAVGAGVDKKDIVELPSPLALENSGAGSQFVRDRARVVCAARLHREKGVDVLVRAFMIVAEDFPDATLHLAGDGPEREDLEKLSSAMRLDGRVVFRGQLPPGDMPAFFGTGLVAVSPSRVEEGRGRSLLEAAMSGCALIGSDLGGIRDNVIDGRTGFLVPPEDPDRLADALHRCLSDPDYALSLGEAARSAALEYYETRDSGLTKLEERIRQLAMH
jgi:glycosyltransferase involved in cell wall biosynthesis